MKKTAISCFAFWRPRGSYEAAYLASKVSRIKYHDDYRLSTHGRQPKRPRLNTSTSTHYSSRLPTPTTFLDILVPVPFIHVTSIIIAISSKMLSLFGFGPLIYVSVLLLNAVAILSEDRFLARIGMGRAHLQQSSEPSFGGATHDPDSLKSKTVNLISSIRMVTRVPLIAVNVVLIVYELMLG
jgi:immediate early response 3-interacting protein 1